MKIYRVYGIDLYSTEVIKETGCYYWIDGNQFAFHYAARIEKRDACLTPQQAFQEAINGRKTMKGTFEDKLAKVNQEILALESLEQEYNNRPDVTQNNLEN